ncbi:PAS domain S-box protein [Pseudomonas sp. v388]|uniref:PAS domain S-box protein n=1 Tax=Pseudomonas sp. v388 TaxID=2479849 RepID=UPI000F76CCD1|nr:PAS domain S-box protein [Pseudomonas sp. v388]RRV08411.1 PAS domain S-box protein [Pseudomonas sp. v388]
MINAKLLQLVIDASSDGIVVAEQEGDDNILIYANQAFTDLTGYTNEEILYRDCRFLQGDDRQQAALAAIRQAISKGEHSRQILRNYRKDGSVFWNELSITPVRNDASQMMYYIGIQKDVTAQVRDQERIRELEAALVAAEAKIAALSQ